MLISKGGKIYDSRRRALVKTSQTNWHKATQCAKGTIRPEGSQPHKGIINIHETSKIINLFLGLTL